MVPTLNEEHNLPSVLGKIPDTVTELVIVDGGSNDDTVAVARALRPDATIVRQTRRGKGNALVCGFEACTGDIVVMIDADGSTDPREINDFVQALVDGADFAKGSRFAGGGSSLDLTPSRRWGNNGLNGLVNLLFRTRYSDLCYGYNAIWRHRIPALRLPATQAGKQAQWGDGFEIETMINIRAAVLGLSIAEVPSVELARIHGVSKLSAVRDGLRVLRTIMAEYAGRRALTRAPAPIPHQRQAEASAQPRQPQPGYRSVLAREES
ncbi:MAG: glycosyltransferase family 2 protein [Hamadaea sp.]|nr:glycosyltransferase family 2 protein [Hamadaea sp.]